MEVEQSQFGDYMIVYLGNTKEDHYKTTTTQRLIP